MKIIFIIFLLFSSCTLKKYNNSIENCLDTNFKKLIISQPDDIYIKIPLHWSVIDSSIYGIERNLVNTKTVYSEDSSNSIFFIVQDFKQGSILNNDTSEIKKYIDAESKELANGRDSTITIKAYTLNGLYTVTKKSLIKDSSQFKFLGQILSVQGPKRVHILVRGFYTNFETGNTELECILSSYSILKQ